jgi:hypothetical protein
MSTITQARAVVLSNATSSSADGHPDGLEVEWTARLLLGVTITLSVVAGFLWELGSAFTARGLGVDGAATQAVTNAHAADLTLALVGALLALSVGAFIRLRGNRHRITTIGVLGLATLAALVNMVSQLT